MEIMDWSLITESFSEQEKQGIIIQKFYKWSMFGVLDELWGAIDGIYNILATIVPIQVLWHLEETRKKYMDIKILSSNIK
jgi:hypothetical protein